MKLLRIMALPVVLIGCAVPSSGITHRGEGLYTVTRQGEGFWVTTDQLKAQALSEATRYCELEKKNMKLVHSKEIQAGALGRWPESEVLFKCE